MTHVERFEEQMSKIIEKAVGEGRVPSECIQLVPIDEDHAMKVVVFHEA